MDGGPTTTPSLEVLVVDDDQTCRDAVGRQLVALGHRPVCFPSVENAVPHLSRARVDLMVLDVHFPGIGGIVFLDKLRDRGVPIPIVMMSGADSGTEARRRAVAFLRKPFTRADLAAAIRVARVEYEDGAPPDPSASHERVRAAIREQAHKLLDGDGLPILDESVAKIHGLFISPECSARAVEAALGREPRLVAEVLRAANSPRYRGATALRNLNEAIVRLGNKEVLGVVLNSLVRSSFRVSDPDCAELCEDYWGLALETARTAKSLSLERRLGSPDELFIAGLLHNVGEVLAVCAISCVPNAFRRIGLEEARAFVEQSHESLGRRVLAEWDLPPYLAELAGRHHRPDPFLDPETRLVMEAWRAAANAEPLELEATPA